MKRSTRWIGLAAAAAAGAGVALALARTARDLPHVEVSAHTGLAFVASLALYLAALVIGGCAWHVLLRALGVEIALGDSIAITLSTQAGKYLPGNFAHYVGRTALLVERGVAWSTAALSLILEAVCLITLGSLAAVLLLPGSSTDLEWKLPGLFLLMALATVCAKLLLSRPRVRQLIERRGVTLQLPRLRDWLLCQGIQLASFTACAASADVLAHQLLHAETIPFSRLLGAFAAAWVAGFLVPGAPAGLGVREALLAAMLSPVTGTSVALALPLLFRLVSTAGDASAFLLGLGIRRLRAAGARGSSQGLTQ